MTFRDLYQKHIAFVWRSLRRLGLDDATAKDASQEVFLVVHRRLPEFVSNPKITAWLFQICLYIARDHRRRAYVRYEVLDDSVVEVCVDPSADVAERAERQESVAFLEAALARLNLDQRAVFILFEFEGMTGDEIAETLGIPLGTVYSRLRLGRSAFRKALLLGRARDTAVTRLVSTR
jgi:RNA polymerase sigma-70 factor, ECF subfamily